MPTPIIRFWMLRETETSWWVVSQFAASSFSLVLAVTLEIVHRKFRFDWTKLDPLVPGSFSLSMFQDFFSHVWTTHGELIGPTGISCQLLLSLIGSNRSRETFLSFTDVPRG